MVFEKISSWTERVFTPDKVVQRQFALFKILLGRDRASLKLITRLEEMYHQPIPTDWSRVAALVNALASAVERLAESLQEMRPKVYAGLSTSHARIKNHLDQLLVETVPAGGPPHLLFLDEAWAYPELCGGKAAALARIGHETSIPVPPGLVVTTNAFQAFIEENHLQQEIARQLRSLELRRPENLVERSESIRRAILGGEVPESIRQGILEATARLVEESQVTTSTWAVRSSATAEDGEVSFAGQYATVLNVATAEIAEAYKTVLASKYSPTALAYRLHSGLADAQLPMAVLILPMINSRTSGVMYTRDPLDAGQGDSLVVTAVPGLGIALVDGSTVPDQFVLSRRDPEHFWAKKPAYPATTARIAGITGGASGPFCIAEKAVSALARWGLELEALSGGAAQDVEWTEDHQGRLLVLQSRPINAAQKSVDENSPAGGTEESLPPVTPAAELLEMGIPASVGVAAGEVYRHRDGAGLHLVPPGSVLVTSGIPPSLVPLAHKVRAVLAEHGSKASHFASVAREFGLPLVVGLGELDLRNGQIVTVDAYRGVVYAGEVAELLAWQEQQQARPPLPFQEKLAPIMALISPLNLTDPASAEFRPENCRSFHDLVRFVHEKGTEEMFSLVDKGRGLRRAKVLESAIPMVMQVLDLGGGLSEAAGGKKSVAPDDFASAPMRAVWAGLAHQDVTWSEGLLHLDWERFDQISGGIFDLKTSPQLASYALVAGDYAHLLLRFGYHFAIVDTLAGDRPEENYIQFRFKGGGGMVEKKSWRLAMLGRVLGHFGFQVQIQEDMLEAKCMRQPFAASQHRLKILGYLLGRTPLLDMALESEADALAMAEQMIAVWQNLPRAAAAKEQSSPASGNI
jgi:pyruvate, water dikinase